MIDEEFDTTDELSERPTYGYDVAASADKLQQLQALASGKPGTLDTAAVKARMALFLLAHADKTMDTVAPLEVLRDELVRKYSETVQDRMEDPDITPGAIAKMIGDIQIMNSYSFNMLKSLLDADKLQTLINIDASTNTVNTQVNTDIPVTPAARARVLKALELVTKAAELQNIIPAESDNISED